MTKRERQQKILDLISTKDIPTQEDLTEQLEKSGVFVNQSSVSRDLDELDIVKINGFYSLPKIQKESNRFGLLALETAGENLIVAKCEIGLASAIALQIDRAKLSEIVGTVAGDDTIFIAVKDLKTQKTAMRKIWEVFQK